MSDEITLADKYRFVKNHFNQGREGYELQGEHEGAFYIVVDHDKKIIEILMNQWYGDCCSKGGRALIDWHAKECAGKSCFSKEDGCTGDDCPDDPITKAHEEMIAYAEKAFPNFKVKGE